MRRKGADPWLGFLMPDSTGVVAQERFLFQKLPFSEDIRDFTFPSFALKVTNVEVQFVGSSCFPLCLQPKIPRALCCLQQPRSRAQSRKFVVDLRDLVVIVQFCRSVVIALHVVGRQINNHICIMVKAV